MDGVPFAPHLNALVHLGEASLHELRGVESSVEAGIRGLGALVESTAEMCRGDMETRLGALEEKLK